MIQPLQQEQSADSIRNVILLGSTGDGKSTLGNYLNNCRRCDQPFIFEESTNPQPHTQEVIVKTITEFNTTINLYDTPGLNEHDAEKDFLNMLDILNYVRHMQHITCLLLVIRWDFKTDNQTVLSLKYIKKLFRPVFDAGNVIFVFTKVPPETYLVYTSL
jgi:GTPase Era involved in 16S rRNA processing